MWFQTIPCLHPLQKRILKMQVLYPDNTHCSLSSYIIRGFPYIVQTIVSTTFPSWLKGLERLYRFSLMETLRKVIAMLSVRKLCNTQFQYVVFQQKLTDIGHLQRMNYNQKSVLHVYIAFLRNGIVFMLTLCGLIPAVSSHGVFSFCPGTKFMQVFREMLANILK